MSGGGVLQHLMAEQSFRSSGNSTPIEAPRNAPRGSSPHTKGKNPPPGYPRAASSQRRAMSDEAGAVQQASQARPFLNTSSRSGEATVPQFSSPHPQSRWPGDSGVISRLRKEFSNKLIPAHLQVKSTRQQNAGSSEITPGEMNNGIMNVAAAPANMIARTSFPSPSASKQQLHGHPKSNSAGEEFLYTDRKAKLAASKLGRRRGKNAASVMRSRSLHYGEDAPTPLVVQRRPNTDLGLGTEPFTALGTPRKRSDASTVSTGSVASDKPASHGSSAGEGYFHISVNEDSNKVSDLPQYTANSGSLSELGNTQTSYLTQLQSNMVLTPSGMVGLPQPAMTHGNPHGPYYATVPANPIGHHSPPPSTIPQPQVPQTATPQRGPPPPYPQGNGLNENSHPQRPNSLPLSGQISRKKIEYGGTQGSVGRLTSPAISTSAQISNFNYPVSAGTPFYSFPLEMADPSTTGNSAKPVMQAYAPPPQQTAQTQFKRSGSGNGFQQIAATSQPQVVEAHAAMASSNATTFQQQARYEQAWAQMHKTPQKQHSTSPTYAQQPQQSGVEYQTGYSTGAGSTSGFSLGKSDSNASTSSAGSRIARRNKRNSKNYSNISGSSSSTGNSRPNSSADYLERILSENETLKSQLHSAEKKMKKFQNVEKELMRVTEDYSNLHLSVNKRENMQQALMTQLEAENARTQQENEILRERISTLTELVETLQCSNKSAQSPSSDIMMYKVKVQEHLANEQLLSEQLNDAKEKIKEQEEDMSLMSSSIKRMQTNVASLNERLLERRRSERCVEELSPLLDMLTQTVKARLQAENELNEIFGVAQRQSTSSNDEGISEMDTVENTLHAHSQSCSTQSNSSMLSRDEQLVRTQAQMLKWQHMYLQSALLRELSIAEGTLPNSPRPNGPLYTMLYKHRHAASDPSFNKNMVLDLPIWHTAGLRTLYRREVEVRREVVRADSNRQRMMSDNDRRHGVQLQEDITREKTSTDDSRLSSDKKLKSPVPDFSNSERSERKKGQTSDTQAEVDSPSEGYHSQQSSGSPTPSSERSSAHFPEEETRAVQDTPNTTTSRQSATNPGRFVASGESVIV